jgi:hypothetical protein
MKVVNVFLNESNHDDDEFISFFKFVVLFGNSIHLLCKTLNKNPLFFWGGAFRTILEGMQQ